MNAPISRLAIVLGLLTAIGPFAIDMYLPALPAMAPDLHAGSDALQASLMSFYLALGAGQLVAGPLSDAFGRKRPLYLGLAVFVLAGLGCAFAHDVHTLIALRLLQGLGACASMVTPRAVVRDIATGPEAARLMALLMTIYSVSPICAPLAGSFVADAFGWRAVFLALAVIGALGFAMVATQLPETRAPEKRTRAHPRDIWRGYRTLLGDPHFLVPAAMASLTLAGFFIYVAGSPFVMTAHYGLSSRSYALLFALNVLPYVAVTQTNRWLTRRFTLRQLARGGAALQFAGALVLLVLFASGIDSLWLLQLGLMMVFACTGAVMPALFVIAMERHATLSGSASALLGTLNFAGGAVAMAIVAPFSNGTPLPILTGIATSTALVFGLSRLGPRADDRSTTDAVAAPAIASDAG